MPRRITRPRPIIAAETSEYLDPHDVRRHIETRAGRERRLGLIASEARRRGYAPGTRPQDVFGHRKTYRMMEEVQPPKGSREAPVRDLSFELLLQSFTKRGSDVQAAVGIATITAGDNTETYEMLLEAPGGNLAKIREYCVKDDAVVPTSTWADAFSSCFPSSCAGDVDCMRAYTQCAQGKDNVGEVLACLLICGACAVRCAACATCNCKWWCKKSCGCCKR